MFKSIFSRYQVGTYDFRSKVSHRPHREGNPLGKQ